MTQSLLPLWKFPKYMVWAVLTLMIVNTIRISFQSIIKCTFLLKINSTNTDIYCSELLVKQLRHCNTIMSKTIKIHQLFGDDDWNSFLFVLNIMMILVWLRGMDFWGGILTGLFLLFTALFEIVLSSVEMHLIYYNNVPFGLTLLTWLKFPEKAWKVCLLVREVFCKANRL